MSSHLQVPLPEGAQGNSSAENSALGPHKRSSSFNFDGNKYESAQADGNHNSRNVVNKPAMEDELMMAVSSEQQMSSKGPAGSTLKQAMGLASQNSKNIGLLADQSKYENSAFQGALGN